MHVRHVLRLSGNHNREEAADLKGLMSALTHTQNAARQYRLKFSTRKNRESVLGSAVWAQSGAHLRQMEMLYTKLM